MARLRSGVILFSVGFQPLAGLDNPKGVSLPHVPVLSSSLEMGASMSRGTVGLFDLR